MTFFADVLAPALQLWQKTKMAQVARFFTVLLFACLQSCSGQFFISTPPTFSDSDCNGDCSTVASCSPSAPTGLCPPGQSCVSGKCFSEGVDCCSTCAANEGCQDCVCTPVTVVNQCSFSNPSGVCANQEVCVGGFCSPARCDQSSSGCCPSGTTCSNGACRYISDRPCANFPTDGFCPAGERCDNGACVPASCAQAICGACDVDEECRDSTCVKVECGPQHITGTCPLAEKCSVTGTCIDEGTCIDPSDCNFGDFCCSTGSCIEPGQCCQSSECQPGFVCSVNTCVPEATGCTTNARVPNTGICAPDQLYCCPAGETCCDEGFVCNVGVGACIAGGACIDFNDCSPGFSCVNGACTPDLPCTGGCSGGLCQGDCPEGQACSFAGGCIPAGRCVLDLDCPPGAGCNASYQCEIDCGCGCDQFSTSLVAPNVLTMVDRSYSMTSAVPNSGLNRWEVATNVIDQVMNDFSGQIRFGLGTFPGHCSDIAANQCSLDCPEIPVCASQPSVGQANCYAGQATFATGSVQQDMVDSLTNDCPGGQTPTGPTFINLLNTRVTAGIADSNRNNAIVLITDGDANCSPNCGSTVDQAAPGVYSALDALRLSDPSVTTYTVGFGVNSRYLSCYAVHGGTSRCSTDDVACGVRSSSAELCRNVSCEWNGNQCVGSAAVCSTFTGQTECNANGCAWSTGTSQCLVDSPLCAQYTTEEDCELRCAYRTQSSCSPRSSLCNLRPTEAACIASPCAWTQPCIGNDTRCAAFAQSECATNGCAWNGSTNKCEGNDTLCGDGRTTCSSSCVWVPGTGCRVPFTGTGSCSNYSYTNSATCQGYGCIWQANNLCGGSPNCTTTNYPTQPLCQDAGCLWNVANNSCGPDNVSCTPRGSGNSGRSCRAPCVWNAAAATKCQGDDTICTTAAYPNSTACTNAGCFWTPEGTCVGNNTLCQVYTTQNTCEAYCAVSGTCVDNNTCNGFATETSCEALCTRAPSQCTGVAPECSQRTTSSSCTASCDWNGSACVGDSTCTTYSTQSPCQNNGCDWTASGTCVGVNETTCPDAGICYYLAVDQTSLSDSLTEISGELASCTFSLDGTVDWSRIFVFLNYNSPGDLPPACGGRNPCSLGLSGTYWAPNLASATPSLEIFGSYCTAIQTGLAEVFVISGCPISGG